MSTMPQNGTNTHALSAHAKNVLVKLAKAPIPQHELNPGVRNRLGRADFIFLRDGVVYVTEAGKSAAMAVQWMQFEKVSDLPGAEWLVKERINEFHIGGVDDSNLKVVLTGLKLLEREAAWTTQNS